jgi:hypothetical protein
MSGRLARTVTAAFLAVGAVSACDGAPDETRTRLEEIQVHRSLWEAQRPARYRYVLRARCFCGPDAVRPVEVTVEDGAVTARRYADDGTEVPEELWTLSSSVSGLFDRLEAAVDDDADDIQVTWDSESGLPREAFIDFDHAVADEEMGWAVETDPEAIP